MESTFDDAVVAAARDGDPDARARLAADCLPLVYSVVGRAMRGHADVDDVVQETMVRALGKLMRPAGRLQLPVLADRHRHEPAPHPLRVP